MATDGEPEKRQESMISGASAPNYRRFEVEGEGGRVARYWGDVDEKERPHGHGTTLWEDGSNHSGEYMEGNMHGDGVHVFANGDKCAIRFEQGRPKGKGVLTEYLPGDMIEYDVEYDGKRSFTESGGEGAGGRSEMYRTRRQRRVYRECMFPVCGMLVGQDQGPSHYEHCVSVRGKLVWGTPPRGDTFLFNSEQVQGNIVILRRGGVPFSRKLLVAQEAGAVGLIVIGANPEEAKYNRPIPRVTLGHVPGDDLPSHLPPLDAKIPVVYALKRLEMMIQEGGDATLHFDSKCPPGWQSGAVFIQGEQAKTRNPEGEAQAQWSEADLKFDRGGKTMVMSDGSVAPLAQHSGPPRALQCRMAERQKQKRRECQVGLLGGDVTLYGFAMTFGEVKWKIFKRYSEFDALDAKLNALYGLPPAGLPPKKWFGGQDEALLRYRHQMLEAYLCDCVKRPVLTLSSEIQAFCSIPEEVCTALRKGG